MDLVNEDERRVFLIHLIKGKTLPWWEPFLADNIYYLCSLIKRVKRTQRLFVIWVWCYLKYIYVWNNLNWLMNLHKLWWIVEPYLYNLISSISIQLLPIRSIISLLHFNSVNLGVPCFLFCFSRNICKIIAFAPWGLGPLFKSCSVEYWT